MVAARLMAKAFGLIAGKALRTAGGKAESRSKLIGAVRAACRRLGLGDDDRKVIQEQVTGKASMGDMNLAEIGLVLDRLNKGYKGPMGHRAHVGKIRALWWTLYWLAAVNEPNDAAVDAFIERQTGKARIQFLGHKEAFRVIEALKAWAGREGVDWNVQARLAELRPSNPDLTVDRLERHAVLAAIALKLRRAGRLNAGHESYCQRSLPGLGLNHWAWDARQLDAAIRLLGKLLRRALNKRGAEE
jgi:hypothetical protein